MEPRPCTPLEALRKPKIFNMSIFDWVTLLLGAGLLGWWLGIKGNQFLLFMAFPGLAFSVVLHYSFGVKTMLGYYLGLNPAPQGRECL
jgi:hypothetical protein